MGVGFITYPSAPVVAMTALLVLDRDHLVHLVVRVRSLIDPNEPNDL